MNFSFLQPSEFTTRPTLRGTFGMVSSTHWLASATAQSVLERGGNAFDAAVAGGFVLHVVEPHLNGPGGDMSTLVSAEGGGSKVLMGQGPAPAGATIAHYRSEGLDAVPGSGALAAAVPGAVDAWLLLLADRGTMELRDVLSYAIRYARDGHPVLERVCRTIAAVEELFTVHWPDSAQLWMPQGRLPQPGELITNPRYADTLERLIEAGDGEANRCLRIDAARRAWSHGFVADAIEANTSRIHRHSSGTDHAGVITASDVGSYAARWEEPSTLIFRGFEISKTGPWGQGPVLLQTLAILDGFEDARLDPGTAVGAHTIAEALKLAMADRDAYYGDPTDPDAVPLDTLLSEDYAAQRRTLIGPSASPDFRPGVIHGFEPYIPPLVTQEEWNESQGDAAGGATVGEPTVGDHGETRGDTCHIDVIDQWGNMVAATPSGGWLQSSPAIPELGFCLGTRLQMTWLDESAPSALRPGRRPRTTLTPTLVSRNGRVVEALGSPGGDQQEQWQLLYLLRRLVGGYTPQEAIDAPAFHTTSLAASFWPRTWEPAGLVVEDRLGLEVISDLKTWGHRITRAGDWSLGRLCTVGRDDDGVLFAAANPRGMQGYASGR